MIASVSPMIVRKKDSCSRKPRSAARRAPPARPRGQAACAVDRNSDHRIPRWHVRPAGPRPSSSAVRETRWSPTGAEPTPVDAGVVSLCGSARTVDPPPSASTASEWFRPGSAGAVEVWYRMRIASRNDRGKPFVGTHQPTRNASDVPRSSTRAGVAGPPSPAHPAVGRPVPINVAAISVWLISPHRSGRQSGRAPTCRRTMACNEPDMDGGSGTRRRKGSSEPSPMTSRPPTAWSRRTAGSTLLQRAGAQQRLIEPRRTGSHRAVRHRERYLHAVSSAASQYLLPSLSASDPAQSGGVSIDAKKSCNGFGASGRMRPPRPVHARTQYAASSGRREAPMPPRIHRIVTDAGWSPSLSTGPHRACRYATLPQPARSLLEPGRGDQGAELESTWTSLAPCSHEVVIRDGSAIGVALAVG